MPSGWPAAVWWEFEVGREEGGPLSDQRGERESPTIPRMEMRQKLDNPGPQESSGLSTCHATSGGVDLGLLRIMARDRAKVMMWHALQTLQEKRKKRIEGQGSDLANCQLSNDATDRGIAGGFGCQRELTWWKYGTECGPGVVHRRDHRRPRNHDSGTRCWSATGRVTR